MAGDSHEAGHDQQCAGRDIRIRAARRQDGAGWGAKSTDIRSVPTAALSPVGVNQVAEHRARVPFAGLVPRPALVCAADVACDDDDDHGALSRAPVDDAGLSFFTFESSTEEEIDASLVEALRGADWPSYTILCPLYREARIVPQFVRAMMHLDYPVEKLQILFLTEMDDSQTRNAIRALALPPHFQIVTVPEGTPRTKPRACNFGLMQATGQYLVIYDAEDIPEPTQLKKAVLTFANHGPDLGCVQAKLNFYNPHQNVLTRWFTAEYSLWFDLILPGLQRARLALPLGGTSNHFPTRTLRALGGWDAFNVTEDCDLGLRLSSTGSEPSC